jgi:uncharacterized protein YbaR (Trm112 family)
MIDPKFLEILCCPLGKADLKEENDFLICTSCGLKYPIREGIPVLLLDEAILPEGVKSISDLKCGRDK